MFSHKSCIGHKKQRKLRPHQDKSLRKKEKKKKRKIPVKNAIRTLDTLAALLEGGDVGVHAALPLQLVLQQVPGGQTNKPLSGTLSDLTGGVAFLEI